MSSLLPSAVPVDGAETAQALRQYAKLLGDWSSSRLGRKPWARGETNLEPTLRPVLDRALRGLELHVDVPLAKRFRQRHDELLALVAEADRYPLEKPDGPITQPPRKPHPNSKEARWRRRIELDLEIVGANGRQRASVPPDRGADRIADPGVSHDPSSRETSFRLGPISVSSVIEA